MSSENENDIVNSFYDNTRSYFPGHDPYTNVRVLMLWWAGTDLKIDKEVKVLAKLFKDEFRYDVTNFVIPSNGEQNKELSRELMGLNEQLGTDSLLIIYYAGHCKADEKGYAQWWALEHGGPSLSWHIMQQLLFFAKCDVLLLLDCCDAALIANGTKDEGRFEMIAACAKGCRTVAPSPESFTRVLIKELKSYAKEGITAPELSSRISENRKIQQTCVFHNFARNTPTHIELKRISEPLPEGFAKKPASFVVFVASLSEDPKGKEIAEWIKAAPPSQVMGVDIEALVLRARRLQGFEESSFAAGPIFKRLSKDAQQEIFQTLCRLHNTMDFASLQATNQDDKGGPNLARKCLEDIEEATEAFYDALETPVLQELSTDEYDVARLDPYIKVTEAADSILLRQAVLGSYRGGDGPEIPRGKLRFIKAQQQRQVGQFDNKSVIIEVFSYLENPKDGGPYDETLGQVRKISGLLLHIEKNQHTRFFHILPCLGYFHDRENHQLGLVFEPSCSSSQIPITLFQLYRQERIVALGHRIRLTYALAMAVERFHRVGWVHKGIRSTNVLFIRIPPKDKASETGESPSQTVAAVSPVSRVSSFDLAQPYLFGFEYSRAGDAGTNMEEDYSQQNNLYRHPDRWGRPLVRFEKFHDVYALGVLMFEVLLWKDIDALRIKEKGKNSPVNSRVVYDIIKEKSKSELPHRFGDVITHIVLTCIDFKELTEIMNEYESQRYFQEQISGRIGKLVGKI
ncbi:hypothetical protein F5Y04DRAFT_240505 [Hypomontagnella monticulosa]|nr:hypothetical protein F5Y04DRAFT_240505 [Hypomontagnella monticulosa]